nr:flagellar hook-length control protein FliK [uncultured Cohaesibacter sp.]
MAMEIFSSPRAIQSNALNSLLNALGNGQPKEATVLRSTNMPNGEMRLQLSVSGTPLELKVSAEAGSQLKPNTNVLVQAVKTEGGMQLAIRPMEEGNNLEGGKAVVTSNSGKSVINSPPAGQTGSLPSAAGREASSSPSSSNQIASTPYGRQLSATPTVTNGTLSSQLDGLALVQRQAMDTQRSLTDLFANLDAFIRQIETGQRPAVPQDLETAMKWVLGFRVSSSQLAGSDKASKALRQIISSFGLMSGATSSEGKSAAPDITANFKASLSLLRALLPNDGPDLPSDIALQRRDQPPLKGADLPGQRPQAATIFPSDSNSLALARLKSDVEAAIARTTLTQIASLRSSSGEVSHTAHHALQTIHTEVPVMLANGTAVIPLTLQRETAEEADEDEDGDDAENKAKKRGWKVQFAIDTEGLGAVSVALRLRETLIHLDISVERSDTLALLQEAAQTLQTTLENAGLQLEGCLFKKAKDSNKADLLDLVPSHTSHLDRSL